MNPVSSIRPFVPPPVAPAPLPMPADAAGAVGRSQTLGPNALAPAQETRPASGDFADVFGKFVKEVDARQQAAGDAVTGLMNGQQVSLHQAMIAMEEAGLSFHLMVEVRNKLLEAYQELMRMHV